MVKIYTSPTCGICKIMKIKMDRKNIPYEESMDYSTLVDEDIFNLPVLELEDGTLLSTPGKINQWIDEFGEE